jgi:hypothetical protein
VKPVLATALLVAHLHASPAAAGDGVGGSFRSGEIVLEPVGAVAFRGKATLDGAEAIVVAVSNMRFKPEALADYADRRLAIDRRFKDDRTGVVYLEFRPNGQYRGLSYYFAPGNGCGYCSGEVTSTAKLANGRIVGSLRNAEKDRPFDLALDVAILPDAHGAALPADGGAPGRAFLAYDAALARRDLAALKRTLSAGALEPWARAEAAGQVGRYVDSMAEDHPDKGTRVTGGYAGNEKAVVLFAGDSAAGKVRGEALLVREKDGWRVDDELMALVPK